ncbi:MAG: PepSY domain-containing protein [Rudaea sp.]|uniref:PepSY-associated TM helix domain-containing protein n=1 Tax=unclassified Rudaea TaxID=2627037 RepID=UPI0010F9CFBF|nr:MULTISPECIES: PepSY-associated TM helix domain-containing protein [unclassified Rudaea]MBN8886262.1 PepSY domain-containing protein [Rudaea sp.]
MASFLRIAHKYLSLTFGLLWLLQTVTGTLLVFRGELDDAFLAGPDRPLAPAVLGAAVTRIAAERAPSQLTFILASEGSKNRFDLLFEAPDGRTRVLRVDGEGRPVADRPRDHDYPAPGLFQTALDFHESLFAGQRGMWFMGISGLLLLSNLIAGLVIAWPKKGQAWRRVLLPSATGSLPANLYKWHRALGLAFAVFAIAVVATGVLQEYPVDDWMGVQRPEPPKQTNSLPPTIAFGDALSTALIHYPGAPIALIEMPAPDHPWYRIRLRQEGDSRRVFGWTSVLVDAHDGRVLLDMPAAELPLNAKIYNSFYSIHTGEFFGLGGRIVVLCVGLWLTAMGTLGAMLWWTRRKARAAQRPRTRTAEA